MIEREVTKTEFKKLYFKYAVAGDGWTLDYWNQFFEKEEGAQYFFEKPASRQATRMFIVSEKHRHRMTFLNEEGEESLFDSPGKG